MTLNVLFVVPPKRVSGLLLEPMQTRHEGVHRLWQPINGKRLTCTSAHADIAMNPKRAAKKAVISREPPLRRCLTNSRAQGARGPRFTFARSDFPFLSIEASVFIDLDLTYSIRNPKEVSTHGTKR